MKKKMFSLLLAVCLLLGAVPVTARAGIETQCLYFLISDGKFHVGSATGSEYTGQPDAWSWDSETQTLSLNNFEWVTTAAAALSIIGSGGITVDLNGVNSFESTAPELPTGIGGSMAMTFTGRGALYALGNGSIGTGLSSGIRSITIDGPTIFAQGKLFGIVCRGLTIYSGALYVVSDTYALLASNTPGDFFVPVPDDLAAPIITVVGGLFTAQGKYAPATNMIITAPTYQYWVNTAEAADPGGEGTVYPPTVYVYDFYNKFIKIDATGSPSEAPTLTGTISSYNPNNPATVQLLRGDKEACITDTEVQPGSGPAEQPFTFANVAPGDYTLVVTKPGHASYTQIITVGPEDIDLSPLSRAAGQAITLPCGDINGDNMVNDGDLAVLWLASNYNKPASADNELCDLNGDGMVNDGDLAILWMAANYNKGAVVT